MEKQSPDASSIVTTSATLNRRDALIRLLRLGGITAGTAGLGLWLSEHSQRPAAELAIIMKRNHSVASNAALPTLHSWLKPQLMLWVESVVLYPGETSSC